LRATPELIVSNTVILPPDIRKYILETYNNYIWRKIISRAFSSI